MCAKKLKLPECGLYLGSGVYPMSQDYLLSSLYGHYAWSPQTFSVDEHIAKIVDDNQGNVAQFWGVPRGYAPKMVAEWLYALDEIGVEVPEPNWETGEHLRPDDCPQIQAHKDRLGAGALRFAKKCAEKGIYTTFLYTEGEEKWSQQIKDLGDMYLGYDFGERFSFRLDDRATKGKDLYKVTLVDIAEGLLEEVREHCDARKAAGWGAVMATSSNFFLDYEVVAGADIPLVEDFAFQHLNFASALSRGLYRQHDLSTWGSHIAHDHYSWIPLSSPYKFKTFTASLYQKYMAGCKIIINESGNWFMEASLCEDSPRFTFPRPHFKPKEISWHDGNPQKWAGYIEEARKHYHKIDYNSDACKTYRKEISDFYDFVKANGTPEGQPESTLGIIKGNYDLLSSHTSGPESAVAGASQLASENPRWFAGSPERTWDIVKDVFYPLPDTLGEHTNYHVSGTPYGQVDIVSFAKDMVDAEQLSSQYKALMFSGWNTCSDKQYATLTEFVKQGGTLFLSIPHLSTDVTRNYTNYSVEDLVNGGDFSELCGVKVKGKGHRFYWATPKEGCDEFEFIFPRRFGVMGSPMGDIEITDPNAEVLIVDDEVIDPFLIKRKLGAGTVYFLNSWSYPSVVNVDRGPGAVKDTPGLIGYIYQHIANSNRGTVWITDDGKKTGAICSYISYSYFPESQQVCLYNVDFDHPHTFYLHDPAGAQCIELAPGEFKLMPYRCAEETLSAAGNADATEFSIN